MQCSDLSKNDEIFCLSVECPVELLGFLQRTIPFDFDHFRFYI